MARTMLICTFAFFAGAVAAAAPFFVAGRVAHLDEAARGEETMGPGVTTAFGLLLSPVGGIVAVLIAIRLVGRRKVRKRASALRFLDTYSIELGRRVSQMTASQRKSLLRDCIKRIPERVRSVPDVENAIRSFEEGEVLSPEELIALAETADAYFGKSMDAEALGDDENCDFFHRIGCALAGMKYLLRGHPLTDSIADDSLYYLTGAMDVELRRVMEGHSPRRG